MYFKVHYASILGQMLKIIDSFLKCIKDTRGCFHNEFWTKVIIFSEINIQKILVTNPHLTVQLTISSFKNRLDLEKQAMPKKI